MKNKPNVIFIMSDDQGAWAMRCAGNKDIITPNLDALAKRGTRLENFFCTSPVCSPARASLLTGTIPSCHGVLDWIRSGNLDKDKIGETAGMPCFNEEKYAVQYLAGMTTYTDILAENGYTCALSGKWHLGDSKTPQHGFSKWFTIGRGGCAYYGADLVYGGEIHIEPRYITDVITDKAIELLDELCGEEKPFYLSVHYTSPHSPWDEKNHPQEYLRKYENCAFTATPDLPIHKNQVPTAPSGVGEERKDHLRGYYASITAMDDNIGRILAHLNASGEEENTIVIFTSDNGMNMGHHGVWGKGNGTFPFNMFDTAVKVPFIFCAPASSTVPQNSVITSMHSQYDFMPTLLDYLGISYNRDEKMPGESFANSLRGSADTQDGEIVVFDEYGPTRMIRSAKYKYIHRYVYGPHEFYDLIKDPDEENNLADDLDYSELVCAMKKRMNNWFYTYADPRVDASKEAVSGYGQLCRAGIFSNGQQTFYVK